VRKPDTARKARKIAVPIVLAVALSTTAVTVATTAVTVVASAGCDDDDNPPVDAGVDTPLI
jgi:hypothetical protein